MPDYSTPTRGRKKKVIRGGGRPADIPADTSKRRRGRPSADISPADRSKRRRDEQSVVAERPDEQAALAPMVLQNNEKRKKGAITGTNSARNIASYMEITRKFLEERFTRDSAEAIIRKLYSVVVEEAAKRVPEAEAESVSDITNRAFVRRARDKLADTEGSDAKDSIANLLSKMDHNTLREELPKAFLASEAKKVRQEYADGLRNIWSVARCVSIKTRNFMSRRKWERLRKYLSYDYDSSINKFVRKTIGGVLVPELPPHKQLRNFAHVMAEKYNMQVDLAGLSVSVDLLISLKKQIAYSVKHGTLNMDESTGRITALNGDKVIVQVKMDKANMHKGMEETAIAFVLVNGTVNPNAPSETHTFCLFEKDDHWASVKKFGAKALAQVNALLTNSRVDVPSEDENSQGPVPYADLVVLGGGDLSNVNDMLCVTSCNGVCPCPFCEQPREEMCNTNPTFIEDQIQRTPDRIKLLAHAIEGECPGCKAQIVEVVEYPDTQVPIANPDDKEPAKAKWNKTQKTTLKKGTDWVKVHCGIKYGRTPLINFPEVTDWVMCLLHMNLRIVGSLFKELIVGNIDLHQAENTSKTAQTDELLKIIVEDNQIHMKKGKLEKPKNSLDTNDFKKVSFAGSEASALLTIYPLLLNVVFPCSVREKNPAVRHQYEQVANAWKLWAETWKLVNSTLDVDSDATRKERALAVAKSGKEFVDAWVVAHKRTQGLYLHLLVAHVPEMIRRFGDLRSYSSQGLEHDHSVRKKIGLQLTNRKPGQRLKQKMVFGISYTHTTKEFRQSLDATEWKVLKRAKEVKAERRAARAKANKDNGTCYRNGG